MTYLALSLIHSDALPHTTADKGTLTSGFNVFYEIIGAVALLLIVIAALRYMIAGSDSAKVAESKKMIAYTLVGLVVIGLAGAIVQFVLKVKV